MLALLLFVPIRRGLVGLGFGFGESTYGALGLGDVLYTLPDTRLGSFHARDMRVVGGVNLSARMGMDFFETPDGDGYHAVIHTLSLGTYFGDRGHSLVDRTPRPWKISVGAAMRSIDARLSLDPIDPLIVDVVDPETFFDSSRTYSRTYSYAVESDLAPTNMAPTNISNADFAPGLSFRVMREDGVLGLYGAYSFIPTSLDIDMESAYGQSVWETQQDLYLGTEFDSTSELYESYTGSSVGTFGVNLHELAMGANFRLESSDAWSWGVAGDIRLALIDWSLERSDTWTRDSDEETASWNQSHESGIDVTPGVGLEAFVRWKHAAHSRWHIELSGGHAWYPELDIDKTGAAAQIDLSGTSMSMTLRVQ